MAAMVRLPVNVTHRRRAVRDPRHVSCGEACLQGHSVDSKIHFAALRFFHEPKPIGAETNRFRRDSGIALGNASDNKNYAEQGMNEKELRPLRRLILATADFNAP
jgi:hypothetical protein